MLLICDAIYGGQGGAVAATRAAVVEALALVEQLPGASQLDLEARTTQVRGVTALGPQRTTQ
eukprot:8633288-Pyramimonas_sp.AAC.1